ncbi:hypothetical protein [uncultured Cutibacterium sp.]|mgnify:CR=1 FL=1|uniref:hypothetical protein n=1 Tax=uncultured Cutibacterium sp. TaxID=1912223 RepID=UPI002591A64F|nr:hypothetical protein [uncultured Cutibacterium sp.]
MSIHTHTNQEQYRHAPLNGLATGTIVGAVWALAILEYQASSILAGADIKLGSPRLFMPFIFPAVGWLAGLWEKAAVSRDNVAKQKRRVKAITAVMSSLAGVLMGSMEYFLTSLRFASSKEKLIHYLILIVVFSLTGWILGTIGAIIKDDDHHFLIKMSIATAVALFASVAVWFFVFSFIRAAFFFEF